MGCASSRESRSPSGPADALTSAARPVHPTASTEPRSTATCSQTDNQGRLNQPLRAPAIVKHSPPQLALSPWTPSELARQREAFFDTRVSGHPEIWTALKRVCDLVRSGDFKSAQAVFDASGLTCPTGRLAVERRRGGQRKGGVYDDKGLLYEIPGWVVEDPQDLVKEEEGADKAKEIEDMTDDESSEVCEEKKIGEIVVVKARLSDRGTDVSVEVGVKQKVGVVIKKVQEKAEVTQKIRLAYMGKILDEHKTLAASGWKDGHMLNALVFG